MVEGQIWGVKMRLYVVSESWATNLRCEVEGGSDVFRWSYTVLLEGTVAERC